MPKLISVIIPTYRRLAMLRQALQSVVAQDYRDIEIIVVDDHSEDDTPSITKEFPNVVFYQNSTNRGPGYSRKIGLSKCHGDYVVFLDDDDYYIDYSFFSRAIQILSAESEYVFVAAGAKTFNPQTSQYEDKMLNIQGEIDAVDYLGGFSSRYDVPLTFSTIFSYEGLSKCGIPTMEMVNHMPMIMRCLQSGKVYFLNEIVGVYRIHGNNISSCISSSFLIDNLKEKLSTYHMIKSKQLFNEYDQWWLEQLKTTVSYYVYGSHPTMREYRKVYKWCMDNSENKEDVKKAMRPYMSFLIDDRICKCKRKVKKILGIK